jgi:FkbM family methyltransferase
MSTTPTPDLGELGLNEPGLGEDEAEFYLRAAYLAFLNREPDPEGAAHWRAALRRAPDPIAPLAGLLDSDEYRRRAPADGRLLGRLAALDGGGRGRLRRRLRRLLRPAAARAEQAAERRIAVLAAWVAHLSLSSASAEAGMRSVSPALQGLTERLHLDQVALAARLLSIEDDLAAGRAEAERRDGRVQRIEDDHLLARAEARRLLKEQQALASRLLSLEEELARAHAQGATRDDRLRGIEAAFADLHAEATRREDRFQEIEAALARGRQAPMAPGVATLPFENAGLNLTSGPYGRFLTIVPDLIGGALERGEFWDPHLKPIIERCADPARVAIDAGAYIGFHTVFLARHFRAVHSFEPQLRCFRLLNANVELNACARVRTYNQPLYDRDLPMELAREDLQQIPLKVHDGAIDYAAIGNAAALAFVPAEQAEARLRSMTIDELGLEDVGFIKVDTQGCDLRVLTGARRTIALCRPTIAFEFEAELASHHGDTMEDFERFFADLGYDLTEIAHTGPQQRDYLATPRRQAGAAA